MSLKWRNTERRPTPARSDTSSALGATLPSATSSSIACTMRRWLDIVRRFRPLSGSPPLRLHYLDEDNNAAAPVLLMHGEPSWCYLYRNIIPPLAQGHRVLAPDLIGFGRSDKPAQRSDYTFERHVDWMSEFLTRLD